MNSLADIALADEEWLTIVYAKGHTMTEIAAAMECATARVSTAMKKAGIEKRTAADNKHTQSPGELHYVEPDPTEPTIWHYYVHAPNGRFQAERMRALVEERLPVAVRVRLQPGVPSELTDPHDDPHDWAVTIEVEAEGRAFEGDISTLAKRVGCTYEGALPVR